jgi:hypothetical protein
MTSMPAIVQHAAHNDVKPSMKGRNSFARSIVLLYGVAEIFGEANDESHLVALVVGVNRCRVTTTLINRDLLREFMRTNCSVQEG